MAIGKNVDDRERERYDPKIRVQISYFVLSYATI
jgi:hypothetical protein